MLTYALQIGPLESNCFDMVFRSTTQRVSSSQSLAKLTSEMSPDDASPENPTNPTNPTNPANLKVLLTYIDNPSHANPANPAILSNLKVLIP